MDSDRYENFNRENVESLFADKKVTQERLGMPVIVGEWGAFPSKGFTNQLIDHMNGILEKYQWSSAYWQYLPGLEKDGNYSALKRAYPVEVAGQIKFYHYNREKKELEVKWEGSELICYLPFPNCEAEGDMEIKGETVRKLSTASYVRFWVDSIGERTIRIKEGA